MILCCSTILMSELFLHHSSSATGKPQYKDSLHSYFVSSLTCISPRSKHLAPILGTVSEKIPFTQYLGNQDRKSITRKDEELWSLFPCMQRKHKILLPFSPKDDSSLSCCNLNHTTRATGNQMTLNETGR